MEVIWEKSGEKADLHCLAIDILDAARRFYQDPENERAFQKWKAERENKSAS
jgi:hypothetical protein